MRHFQYENSCRSPTFGCCTCRRWDCSGHDATVEPETMERFAITSTEDAAGQLLYSVLSKTQVFPLNVYMYSHVSRF